MLIDLHVNPGQLTPEALAEKTLDAGLDALVITQTNTAAGVADYIKALEAEELVGFAGVELPMAQGSVVFVPKKANKAFYESDWTPPLRVWDLAGLRERLENEDGVILVSHPYCRKDGNALGDRAYGLKKVGGVESRINDGKPSWDRLADDLAERRQVPRLGSCGGDVRRLGAAATVVSPDVATQDALLEALKPTQCLPVEFDKADSPRDRSVPRPAPRRESSDRGGRGGRDGGGRGGRDGGGRGRGGRDGGGRGGREGGGRGGRSGGGRGRR